MILAAGFGSRLKPRTDKKPKALIPYHSKPMIDYQVERLKEINVDEIIINAHHHSEMIEEYFKKNDFGVKICVLVEKEILGTGGGILNAEDFLRDEDYFIVINVDVVTDMNIQHMIEFHKRNRPFATIVVQKRKTSRYLEFDKTVRLTGKENTYSPKENLYAFNGIHIISNRIYRKNYEIKFSGILEIYFDLIQKKEETILGFDAGESSFKDIGKIENLV